MVAFSICHCGRVFPAQTAAAAAAADFWSAAPSLGLSVRALKPDRTVLNTEGHCQKTMQVTFAKVEWQLIQTAFAFSIFFFMFLPHSCTSFGKVTLSYAQSRSQREKAGEF